MKKFLAIILAAVMLLGLCACGSEEEGKTRIGILQFAPHASLDNCYNGIIQGLKDAGFTEENCIFEFVNGQGESETNSLAAQGFVNKGCDIIIAIATPAALPAYAAAKDAGIPVVFSAVSDPVGAGLALSLDDPQTGATGTCDNLNYEAQLQLIRAMQPEAKNIGILWTTSEANSKTQLGQYELLADQYGFVIKSQGVTDASEVASGIAALIAGGIDCVCNLTDNNVVNNYSVVTAATDPAGIPCYGSEEEQVARYGCIASETLDYFALGQETGKIAAEILNGADIYSYAISVVKDSEPVYSTSNMQKFGIGLPDAYAQARKID